ncbi:MAG: hypothetical protein BA863_17475 [Desulfovibrio sp. S3730MH75]|nr:MAG: hypothetical protein BA863_17475 [Desulfovibrio sp. S3730MH75]
MKNKNKNQLIILIGLLLVLGVGVSVYKITALGFSLSPDAKETVWTVEAAVSFVADGGPVEVSMNMPDNLNDLVVANIQDQAPGYDFKSMTKNGSNRGIWTAKSATGPQKIYLRADVYRRDGAGVRVAKGVEKGPKISILTGSAKTLAQSLIKDARKKGDDPVTVAMELLSLMNQPEVNVSSSRLLEMRGEFGGSLGLAQVLLNQAGVTSQRVKGLFLNGEGKKRKVKGYLEVKKGDSWVMLDPATATEIDSDSFLLWQVNNESMLEVIGGSKSKISFSTVATKILANQVAIDTGLNKDSLLIDFSIYSLPLQAQNSFKLLLLIPFGALIVVIMRNLVGVSTSGTFLPILIALTFLQTSLLAGLALFLLIVSVGLVLRSYLSHLNLLLVPRISAVLVFVIIIYLAISVISYKMGSDVGLLVTFFPMIIISWTIERMSILWEEEGPKEVLIQGGGTLLTASLIYLLLSNRFVGHLTYSFPELLLVVLAVILMIGSYTGYRLSELRRFEPLGRD